MACNLSYMRRRMQLGAQPHKAKASGAVATFRTNIAAKLDSLFVDVTPVQDLHGQQHPYPAGGGKNLLPTILADIKAANTSGTWNGNQYVYRGITYTFETDSAGNVTGVKAEGTAGSSVGVVDIGTYTYPAGTYILNGCPTKYGCMLYDGTSNIQDTGTGATFTFTEPTEKTFKIRVAASTNLTTAVYFYPMVRLATVTDATFTPYSNVCPITGWAAAKVTWTGAFYTFEQGGINDTTGEYNNYNTRIRTKEYAPIKGNEIDVIGFGTDGAIVRSFYWYDSAKTFISSTIASVYSLPHTYEVTPPQNAVYYRLVMRNNPDGTNISPDGKNLSLDGTTAVIQFGQTLYGAKIDWNGRKAVCYGELVTFNGSESWMLNSTTTGYYRIIGDRFDVTTTPMFNYLKALAPGGCAGLGVWEGRLNKLQSNKYHVLLVKPLMSVYDTVDKWKEYLSSNPLHALIDLEQPVEIPLDLVDFVTVPGINNVFADCGNVDLSYWTN